MKAGVALGFDTSGKAPLYSTTKRHLISCLGEDEKQLGPPFGFCLKSLPVKWQRLFIERR
jgi:hypothetical protein